ncbi:hypothetical protein F4781DRAFT_27829 [Annulohypoxylon bovei var. microspora]|nr:hypothetical protein F4781DRAFT_27829 [Annulohypoxylon bovei var. microspora]
MPRRIVRRRTRRSLGRRFIAQHIRRQVRHEFKYQMHQIIPDFIDYFDNLDADDSAVANGLAVSNVNVNSIANNVIGNSPVAVNNNAVIASTSSSNNPILGNTIVNNGNGRGRRPRTSPDRNGQTINHHRADGVILNGKFRCMLGDCANRQTVVKNEYNNINSHYAKHDPNSAYCKKQASAPRFCGICLGEGRDSLTHSNFHELNAHIRSAHEFSGTTTAIWAQYETTQDGDVINIPE